MGPYREPDAGAQKPSRGPDARDIEIKITPSMRRKVDDLARWLSAGDGARMRRSTEEVLQLLMTVARETRPRSRNR